MWKTIASSDRKKADINREPLFFYREKSTKINNQG